MFQFGAGQLWFNPLLTIGNNAANPTPKQLGTLQDVSFEITGTNKELRGNMKWPDDVAPSDMKGSGKASFGRLDIETFNQCFFAETPSAGIVGITTSPSTTIPSTPFTITPTVPGSGTFGTDLGVVNAANGARFTRVAASPTAGQYTLAAGVYTFSSADNVSGVHVLISFTYSPSPNTSGETLTVVNHIQGYGPVLEMYLFQSYQGNNGVHIYASRFSSLKAPLKRADYQIVEMDFEFYANPAGNVIDFYQITP